LLVVIVPAAVPTSITAPVMGTVVVAPAPIGIVARPVVIISVSIPVVPVRAIIVRPPPAPSPRIANPGNLVDKG
jgi:hypothetical protein